MTRELSPELFTVDFVGEPGRRAFFLQSKSDEGVFTLAIEKQQVAVLAEKLSEILVLIDRTDTVTGTQPVRDPELAPQPMEPEWRVGTIGLAYEESLDLVSVLLEPIRAESPEEPDPYPDAESLRVMLRRDQVRAFVLHALAVVGEGRPLCQLCGLPIDPAGHICPASNGHRAPA